MEHFTKTIGRIDFSFDLKNQSGEYFYQVSSGSLTFEMHSNDNGKWKIITPVPMFIKNMEQDLGLAIESYTG